MSAPVLVRGLYVEPISGTVYGKTGTRLFRRANRYVRAEAPCGDEFMAHRLVWEAVHGGIPDGLQINHMNGKKNDNRIANLELVTPSGNVLHAYRIGLRSAAGEKNGRVRLTPEQVEAIRLIPMAQNEFARLFGVSRGAVCDVIIGRTWRQKS